MTLQRARLTLAAAVLLAAAGAGRTPLASTDHDRPRYAVRGLVSLGGTRSSGNSINDLGWVAGSSNLPDNRSRHATLWISGFLADLGTLGGPNSAVLWPAKNTRGLVAGIAQTNVPEPNGESWSCSAFFPAATGTGVTCLGVVWEFGRIRPLPLLPGGSNSFATGANNARRVVGWSENGVFDAKCEPPQKLQFKPVVWGPDLDEVDELPLYPGDSSGAATALNDRGQIVGISGDCDQAVGRFTAKHAVLWEDGTVKDIGNLGGAAWHTPVAISERGDIVGFSNHNPADEGTFNEHGFYWTRAHGIRPLRPLTGDVTSQALGINQRRQIVGQSCVTRTSCRAFLWENGRMQDLNGLVAPGHLTLATANDINEAGVITGRAVDLGTGASFAYVATPLRRDDRN